MCSVAVLAQAICSKLQSFLQSATMSFEKLSKEFCAQFQAALAQQAHKPVNEVYQECMKIMWAHKIPRKEIAHPNAFLVHKENRGKLMLSPHNAHRNFLSIKMVGADMTQLTNAVAIELAQAGAARDQQFMANARLVKSADGLLPAITNDERFASVGCGHTVAMCKLANQTNPKTSLDGLKDEHGNLNVNKLKEDPQFRKMIEEGWEWTIVPSLVDEQFPAFAKVAQKALNTANHVGIAMGELETLLTLHDLMEDAVFTENPDWEEAAVSFVEDLCVPCAGYARHLLQFAKLFGGGCHAPHIRLMDNVAKTFQCFVRLGPSFWQAISSAVFHDKTNMYVLTRNALCMVNLTCSITEDGIAKLITKSEISKLASKASAAKAKAAEDTLQDSQKIIEALMRNNMVLTEDEFVECKGKLFVRVGLWCTNTMKKGKEGKVRSLDEIKDLFMKDVDAIAGVDVNVEGWRNEEAPATEEKDIPSSSQDMPAKSASLEDHANPVWIAGQHGFHVKGLIIQKDVSNTALSCFIIEEITAGKEVKVKQACSYTGSPIEATITLAELLDKWQRSKASLPEKLDAVQTRDGLSIDMLRVKIFESICAADSMSQAAQSLEFWKTPFQVRTGATAIKIGALTLAPMVPLMQLTTKCTTTAFKLGCFKPEDGEKSINFFAVPTGKSVFDDGEKDEKEQQSRKPMLAAFWWVAEKSNKREANMEIEFKEVKGKKIPILRNTMELAPFTQLVKYVHVPVKNVQPLNPDEPKKKARKRK